MTFNKIGNTKQRNPKKALQADARQEESLCNGASDLKNAHI
jgi:hypothetical protein